MPRDKKAAKARREALSDKFKLLSTVVVPGISASTENNDNDPNSNNNNQNINENDLDIDDRFVPLAEDDVVTRRAEEKAALRFGGRHVPQTEAGGGAAASSGSDGAGAHHPYGADTGLLPTPGAPPSSAAVLAAAKKSKHHHQHQQQLSNRARKQLGRPTIDDLKARAKREDLIHFRDTDAPDPYFLVELKDMRNTVPVPSHWEQKASFMSHTVDRDASATFEDSVMPRWIRDMDLALAWQRPAARGAAAGGAAADFSLRRLIVPFVVGHELPSLTPYGDLFYEGKDMRARHHGYRPGVLSDRLRRALDMSTSGSTGAPSPPPWLTGMQKVVRLPPSYPNLKIPGVNAPIPSGAAWGQRAGEWGHPPRDAKTGELVYDGVVRSSAAIQRETERRRAAALWGGGMGASSGDNNNNDDDYGIFTIPESVQQQQVEREAAAQKQKQQQQQPPPAYVAPPPPPPAAGATLEEQRSKLAQQRAQAMAAASAAMRFQPNAQALAAQQNQFAVDVNEQQNQQHGLMSNFLPPNSGGAGAGGAPAGGGAASSSGAGQNQYYYQGY